MERYEERDRRVCGGVKRDVGKCVGVWGEVRDDFYLNSSDGRVV